MCICCLTSPLRTAHGIRKHHSKMPLMPSNKQSPPSLSQAQCTWPTLTSCCTTSWDRAWASQMHCLSKYTTGQGQAIMITSYSLNLSFSLFVPWKAWQSKGMRQTSLRRSARGLAGYAGRHCDQISLHATSQQGQGSEGITPLMNSAMKADC